METLPLEKKCSLFAKSSSVFPSGQQGSVLHVHEAFFLQLTLLMEGMLRLHRGLVCTKKHGGLQLGGWSRTVDYVVTKLLEYVQQLLVEALSVW